MKIRGVQIHKIATGIRQRSERVLYILYRPFNEVFR